MNPSLKSLLLIAFLVPSATARAQVSTVVREAIEQVMMVLGKEGAKEGSEALVKIGGKEAVEGVCATIAHEGGDAAVRQIASVAEKAGPQTFMALKNVARPSAMLAPLKELSAELAPKAAQRLAAGAEGKTLGELTEKFGAAALRAEAENPGIGMIVIRDLGSEGVELAGRLSAAQMKTLAIISRDVAALPASEKATVMNALQKNSSGFLKWVGDVIKNKPGEVIVSTALVAELHHHWDEVIGTADKPGLIPQGMKHISDKITPGLGHLVDWGVLIALGGFVLWILLKLRHQYLMDKIKFGGAKNGKP